MSRPRDGSRAKVLQAEQGVGGDKLTFVELQKLAARIQRSVWFKKRNASVKSISVMLGKRTYCNDIPAVNPVIELSKTATDLDLMHAIAHLLHSRDVALHGPEFVRQYLDLTRRFLGHDRYKALDGAFAAAGIRRSVWSAEAKQAAKVKYAKNDLAKLLEELKS
jgi:hypothetical protein